MQYFKFTNKNESRGYTGETYHDGLNVAVDYVNDYFAEVTNLMRVISFENSRYVRQVSIPDGTVSKVPNEKYMLHADNIVLGIRADLHEPSTWKLIQSLGSADAFDFGIRYAAYNNVPKIAESFHADGIKFNQATYDSVLRNSAINGKAEIVQYLAAHGVKFSIEAYKYALSKSAESGSIDLLAFVVSSGVDLPHWVYVDALKYATRSGHAGYVVELHSFGFQFTQDEYDTALRYAAIGGKVSVVKYFSDTSVQFSDEAWNTALFNAVVNGKREFVEYIHNLPIVIGDDTLGESKRVAGTKGYSTIEKILSEW